MHRCISDAAILKHTTGGNAEKYAIRHQPVLKIASVLLHCIYAVHIV